MEISEAKEIVKATVNQAVLEFGSQEALGKKAGLTQGAINKYLQGTALPTGVTAKKLSKATNKDPCWFAPHIFDLPTDQAAA